MIKKFLMFTGMIICSYEIYPSTLIDVSIINLISEPAKYNEKMVVVTGVVGIGHGESALYLDDWSFKFSVATNSICLDIGTKEFAHFHSSASIVYGKFVKNEICGYALVVENMGYPVPRK